MQTFFLTASFTPGADSFSPQNHGCDTTISTVAECTTNDYRTFQTKGGYTQCMDPSWRCCWLQNSLACYTSEDVTIDSGYGSCNPNVRPVENPTSCYGVYCQCSTASPTVTIPLTKNTRPHPSPTQTTRPHSSPTQTIRSHPSSSSMDENATVINKDTTEQVSHFVFQTYNIT